MPKLGEGDPTTPLPLHHGGLKILVVFVAFSV